MRIAIAGGGIGGLSAAAALAANGHEIMVVEKSPLIAEVGAGIQLSPNGLLALRHLGLGADLDRILVRPERLLIRRWEDDSILREVSYVPSCEQRYGLPYTNVHRHELVTVLAQHLERHSSVSVKLGSEIVGVESGDATRPAALLLADGEAIEADVIVGADGIHSCVRRGLFGETPSRFSGAVAYRALIPREFVPQEQLVVTNRLGPNAHVVTYFVGADAKWLNLVCVTPEATWDIESWTEAGSVDALRESFADWSYALHEILLQVEAPVYRWALHDRVPLETWTVNRVTLLGDACHPMLPFMAQGASQAIEDAAALAGALSSINDISQVNPALVSYEETRKPRTNRVQRLSWANRDTFHLPDGQEQRQRDADFGALGDDLAGFDWVYGHDVTARFK